MDILPHAISNNRWYSMWFLTVEKLFPFKYEASKANEEALYIRTQSYKSAPKSIAKNKLQIIPIAMNIKINIKDIVGKVGLNGIIIKNKLNFIWVKSALKRGCQI
jgi:hypothetical protein